MLQDNNIMLQLCLSNWTIQNVLGLDVIQNLKILILSHLNIAIHDIIVCRVLAIFSCFQPKFCKIGELAFLFKTRFSMTVY